MAQMLTSWNRSLPDTEKALEGLEVDETLLFEGAVRMRVDLESMVASFSVEPQAYNPFLVVFRIPFEGNEHLPLTSKEKRFRVRGVVQKANTIMIELRDGASFQSLDD